MIPHPVPDVCPDLFGAGGTGSPVCRFAVPQVFDLVQNTTVTISHECSKNVARMAISPDGASLRPGTRAPQTRRNVGLSIPRIPLAFHWYAPKQRPVADQLLFSQPETVSTDGNKTRLGS